MLLRRVKECNIRSTMHLLILRSNHVLYNKGEAKKFRHPRKQEISHADASVGNDAHITAYYVVSMWDIPPIPWRQRQRRQYAYIRVYVSPGYAHQLKLNPSPFAITWILSFRFYCRTTAKS